MSPKLSTVKAARDVVSSIQHFIPDKHSTFSTPMEEYLKAKLWMLEYGTEFHNLMEQARNDPRCYSEKDFNDPYSVCSIALFPAMEYLGWTVEQTHMV